MASATAEHQLINHQNIGDSFEGVYYAEQALIQTTVNGKDYMNMTLRDKSGSRNVKHWGVVKDVEKGSWVYVSAHVEDYQGNPSIIAKNVEKEDAPQDLSNYTAVYDDFDEFAATFDQLRLDLEELCKKTGDETPKSFIDEVFRNGKFFKRFSEAPGNDRPHYGRKGGLFAQTTRVTKSAMDMAGFQELLDGEKAILLASGLIHRIGACEAFSFEDCMPATGSYGFLLGVNNLTMARLSAALKKIAYNFKENDGPEVNMETAMRIFHAVTSHEGDCVKPMTKEALVLSAAYRSDSELVDAMDFIANDINENSDFTAVDPKTNRPYYTG